MVFLPTLPSPSHVPWSRVGRTLSPGDHLTLSFLRLRPAGRHWLHSVPLSRRSWVCPVTLGRLCNTSQPASSFVILGQSRSAHRFHRCLGLGALSAGRVTCLHLLIMRGASSLHLRMRTWNELLVTSIRADPLSLCAGAKASVVYPGNPFMMEDVRPLCLWGASAVFRGCPCSGVFTDFVL